MPPSSTRSAAREPPEASPVEPRRVSRRRVRLHVKLPEGERWVKPADFTGPTAVIGRVRARFGAAVAAFDADGDGKLDLYLASAVVGPKGVRDVLLLNKGEGRFEDASAAFGLPQDRASLGVAAADFDADRHIDLFLTGVGDNRLLRNRDGKTFEDISPTLKPIGPPAVSLTARWLDLDQDGDLDLYVVNYCAAEHADKAFIGAGDAAAGLGERRLSQRRPARPDLRPPRARRRAPLAVAYGERQGERRAFDRPDSLDGGRGACWAAQSPHRDRRARPRQRPRPRPGPGRREDARRSPCSTIGSARSTRCRSRGFRPSRDVSGLLATDLDADGRADLVAACPERAGRSPGGT